MKKNTIIPINGHQPFIGIIQKRLQRQRFFPGFQVIFASCFASEMAFQKASRPEAISRETKPFSSASRQPASGHAADNHFFPVRKGFPDIL